MTPCSTRQIAKVFFAVLVAALLLIAYVFACWFPCEMLRRDRGRFPAGVFVLNLLLGWSGLSWIAFLAFSLTCLRSVDRS